MQRAVASVLHRVRRSDAEADDIARILVQGDTSANPMWRRRWDFAPIDRGGQPCRSLPKKRHEGTRNRTRVAIAATARLLSSVAGVRCGRQPPSIVRSFADGSSRYAERRLYSLPLRAC